MAQIKLSKLRYIPLITQIQKDYELSYQQAAVYGYLFNHCMNVNKNGYCGYSDQRIADEMNIGYRQFKRELEALKKKNLIITKNPGKRTKKTGESRMLYINTEVYLEEVQMDLKDVQIERLEKENKMLMARLEEMEKREAEYRERELNKYKMYVLPLLKNNVISDDQYPEVYDQIGPLYYSFAILEGHGIKMLHNHIRHIARFKQGKLDNPVAYLAKALEDYRIRVRYGEDTENDGQYD